jgi:mannose-6-phosphate isomerase-like protein (cupin superfamily)
MLLLNFGAYLKMNSCPLKIVPKKWGFEKWIVNNEKYCGKILYIIKDYGCSWHFHKIKDETFYVQSGKIILYYGHDKDFSKASSVILEKGDHHHIPTGLIHKMVALQDTELFEFSTQHFDEDSYRIISNE